jgi:excisionase family DNA binding protein
MEQLLFTIEEVCKILNYGKTKVRELIHDGKLKTVERGKGLRVTLFSIESYARGDGACHEKRSQPKSQKGTGLTRKRGGTTGGSKSTANGTKSAVKTKLGPKLDLKL